MAADNGVIPFQKLLFLVRDWSFPHEYSYGWKGGEALLQKRLATSDKQHPELRSLREHIMACFEDIDCLLMPFPGMQIYKNAEFDGRLCDLEVDFQNNLRELVPQLLAPENLVAKKVNDQVVTVGEFFAYLGGYVKTFQGNQLPTALNVGDAMASVFNDSALSSLKICIKSSCQ